MKSQSLFLLCMCMLAFTANAQRSGVTKIKHPDGTVTVTKETVAPGVTVLPDATPSANDNAKSISFIPVKTYQLTSVSVYALPGAAYTREELQQFDQSLKKDWVNNTLLEFGSNNQIRFKSLGTEVRTGNSATWIFENKNCPSCSKTLQVEILSETETTIDYLMEDEDNSPYFKIKLSFSKI